MARVRRSEKSYPAGNATRYALEQLSFGNAAAGRALAAGNQLGAIAANRDLEVLLRQWPEVAAELDAAEAAALASEAAGKDSYRFPA